jgi:hypothetical protein
MFTLGAYAVYLLVSIALTVWVARCLATNGRIFLVETFGGRSDLADSVNHLLVVGFYLLNVGAIALALRLGPKPYDWVSSIELVSTKIGLVLLILGCMHFINLLAFSLGRRWLMRSCGVAQA